MKKILTFIFITLALIIFSGCNLLNKDKEPQVITIDEVLASEIGLIYEIEAEVIDHTDEGVLVKDDTGYVYVNIGNEHFYSNGDYLGIIGNTENEGGAIQFSDTVEISAIGIGSYIEPRTVEKITPADATSMLTAFTTGEYIQVVGECNRNDEEVTISFTETDTLISLEMNSSENNWECPTESNIMIQGYVLNVTGSNTLNVMYTYHEDVIISFLEIETQIINVGDVEWVDWTTLIENPSSNVSDTFTYESEDDVNYNLPGEYSVTLKIVDGLGNKSSQTFSVIVDDPNVLIKNGDFTNPDYGWGFNNGDVDGGSGTFTIEDGQGVVTVSSTVPEGWGPRLESSTMEFEYGETYVISFRAKADDVRLIGVQIGKLLPEYPWFVDYLGSRYLFEIYTDWISYEFQFTMFSPTGDGQLLFNMGSFYNYSTQMNYNTTLYFDDVEIRKLDPTINSPEIYGVYDTTVLTEFNFDPLLYIEAYDYEDGYLTDEIEIIGTFENTPGVYPLTYRVTDSHGNMTEKSCIITVVESQTISEVLNGQVGEYYYLVATVIAIKSDGFLVTDGNDSIYVYTGTYHAFFAGDIVYIEGETSVYGGAVQFYSSALYFYWGYSKYIEERIPEVHDGANIEVIRYDFAPGTYIQFTGTIEINGDYCNVIIEDTTVIGSLYPYDYSMDFTPYDGLLVTVTGYLLYFNGEQGQYMNIIATEIFIE